MIFVDTSAWFALTCPDDPDHAAAISWHQTTKPTLVTTDYIVDELLTLLRARRESHRAIAMGESLLTEEIAILEKVSSLDLASAWGTFTRFQDKDWSFTDCTSRVVMERLAITTAFAFDDDFRQFGTVDVVPNIAA